MQALQDHEMVINVIDAVVETVINVIEAVVAGTEKFLEVKLHVKK